MILIYLFTYLVINFSSNWLQFSPILAPLMTFSFVYKNKELLLCYYYRS